MLILKDIDILTNLENINYALGCIVYYKFQAQELVYILILNCHIFLRIRFLRNYLCL